MAFIPYSNDKQQSVFITIDKRGRMGLSEGLRKKLGLSGEEARLTLLFDEDSRMIGLSKEMEGIKPFIFDEDRGNATVKNFLMDNDIEFGDSATRYNFNGIIGSVYTFKASKDYNGEYSQVFKQDKNGNLERIDPDEQS